MVKTRNLLLGFLFLSVFLISGCAKVDDGGVLTSYVVARVNGEEIFSDDVEKVQKSFIEQGQNLSSEEVLEQVINQVVLVQQISDEKFSFSLEEAELLLEDYLSFQGVTLEDYKRQVQFMGLSYEDELESFKEHVVIQAFLEEVVLANHEIVVPRDDVIEAYEFYASQSLSGDVPSFDELESQIMFFLVQEKQDVIVSDYIADLRLNSSIDYS